MKINKNQNEPATIELGSNIPDEIMDKYPTRKIGETTAIIIEPKAIPERVIDEDFDI